MPDQQPDQQPDEAAEPQQNVTFPSNGNTAHGYLEVPESGSGAGVVVIQEWWGLTTHMGDVVRRLAAEGFVALAPDLYGGSTTHDSAEAMQLAQTLPQDRAARDLAGAVDYLLGLDAATSSTVGVIGFCMGGGFVLRLAAREGDRVSAAVPFYGLSGKDFDPAGLTAARTTTPSRWRRSRRPSPRSGSAAQAPSCSPTRPVTPSTTTRTCWARTTASRPSWRGRGRLRSCATPCADPRGLPVSRPAARSRHR